LRDEDESKSFPFRCGFREFFLRMLPCERQFVRDPRRVTWWTQHTGGNHLAAADRRLRHSWEISLQRFGQMKHSRDPLISSSLLRRSDSAQDWAIPELSARQALCMSARRFGCMTLPPYAVCASSLAPSSRSLGSWLMASNSSRAMRSSVSAASPSVTG
jgi:hypothetical protein